MKGRHRVTSRRCTLAIAITSAVFAACLPATADTIAYWRFEEGADNLGTVGTMPGTSGHVLSYSGSSILNGSRTNGAPIYVTDSPGPYIHGVGANQLALRFDGNDAWKVLDNALLDFDAGDGTGGDFTIEMFVKVDPVPNNGQAFRLIQKRNFPNAGYDTWVWTGADSSSLLGQVALTLEDTGGGFRQPRSNVRIDDSEWHHLAFRRYWNGSSVRSEVWVDYQLGGSGGGGAIGSLANSRDFFVGRSIQSQGGGFNFFQGWMDEIRVSDVALPPEQFLRTVPAPSTIGAFGVILLLRAGRRSR